MAQNICPDCGQVIALDDLNMKEGVGLCRACGKLSPLADIAQAVDTGPNVAGEPPPNGCSIVDRGPGDLLIRASARSVGGAIACAIFGLIWNGILTGFLCIVGGGLYSHLVGPLPAWFPQPLYGGGDDSPGRTGPQMSVGELWLVAVFLSPFMLVGILIIYAFLCSLFGSVRVRIEGSRARVRTGIGPLSWGRSFDTAAVRRIFTGRTTWKQNDDNKPVIQIETESTIRFGTVLNDRRRRWMVSVLRARLVKPPQTPDSSRGSA